MTDGAPWVLRSGLSLAMVAAAAATILAIVHHWTAPRIAQQQERAKLRAIHQLVPPEAYDNDLLQDTTTVTAPDALGTERPITVYRARRDGKPIAAVMRVVTPAGYNGPIELMLAIDPDGTLRDARVLSHRETPGLGDAIERDKTDWLGQFIGRRLGDPPSQQWALTDESPFDALTGATITARAVIEGIRRALAFVGEHDNALFTADPAKHGREASTQR